MRRAAADRPLYVPFEGPVSTLYAELVERASAEGHLLPGTPGSLALRERPGSGSYWYRRHYDSPGTPQVEDFVCKENDLEAYEAMRQRIEAAEWSQEQVRNLRHLGMQVADKDAARVLVEVHNRELFRAGLVLVGTLAFMSWLNELGVKAVAARTQDIDLARRQKLKLAAPISFLEAVTATRLGFFAIPGISAAAQPTSVKRPGKEGLRVDVLTSGAALGKVVPVPELDWHAQAVPHFDYLLVSPRRTATLAGGHCVPVNAPAPERLAWHKLYSSTRRAHDSAKAEKDLRQAATLLAVLVERDDLRLASTAAAVPKEVFDAARQRLPSLRSLLAPHPQALDEVEQALAGP
ncbi:GSU2403 family nucleotidyltransferase fold protein [Ideonella sp. YS5]|uniref:GSU2403 family nucleotidyltransferase fold protein n=1 Tax=Ideonella sp. YS5 TaxID=3453714 RepID=UPI003EE9B96D